MTLLILSVFVSISASAYDVKVDGIYYNLAKKLAFVTRGDVEYAYAGEIVIPESIVVNEETYTVKGIQEYAFNSCFGLTAVTIPSSVTSIGDWAFSGCSGLTSVSIPNSVTYIGDHAFIDCNGLKSVTIPNSVTSIGNAAFCGCSGLTSVSIPNSVTSIGSLAFYNCSGLTSVTIPNSITSIGDNTFEGCSALTSVTIPNSVTSIGDWAFSNCSGLTSVTIPNSVTYIGDYAFIGCNGLKSVTIPNSVTSIGDWAFSNCSGLTSVTIPNSVTYIGDYAFIGCNGLVSITIGSGVEEIDELAFAECKNLESLTCLAENVPNTSSNAFDGSMIEYSTLVVPESALQAYKTTYPWSGFGTFRTVEETEVETKKCETPTIAFNDGKLTFACATDDVEYISEVTSADISKYYTAEVALTACYDITVKATKTGYDDSDVATAKLYWLTSSENSDIATNINSVSMRGIAIQSSDGFLTITCLDNNERVEFYALNGTALGAVNAIDGAVTFSAKSGSIVVAKIGKESVKVMVD